MGTAARNQFLRLFVYKNHFSLAKKLFNRSFVVLVNFAFPENRAPTSSCKQSVDNPNIIVSFYKSITSVVLGRFGVKSCEQISHNFPQSVEKFVSILM